MAQLVDRQAMRALFHALPLADEELAHLAWSSEGFDLRTYDQAAVMSSHLHLAPSAFVGGTLDSGRVSVLSRHLRGALQACIREDSKQAITVAIGALDNGLRVEVQVPPDRGVRELSAVNEDLKMAKLPSFEGQPALLGMPADVLSDGLTMLHALDLDHVLVRVSDEGLHMEAEPSTPKAWFKHPHASTGLPAADGRLTQGYVKAVADFGAGHGINPASLDLAMIPGGVLRFRYSLDHGTMTYWVACIIVPD